MNLLLLLVPMAALAVTFQQCSGVNFQNAVLSQQWLKDCQEDASKCRAVTENFNAGSSNKNIDFVWVIDNSSSMGNEISIVRNNLSEFSELLGNYTNLKMAVVSTDNAGSPNNAYQSNIQKIEMPTMPGGVDGLQVKSLVRSADALILGALALCPPNATAESWCSKFQANKLDDANRLVSNGHWRDVYQPTIGALNGFLREQSHKVFVIVSDDDASSVHDGHYHIKGNNFLDAYDSRFPNSKPIVYSIVSPYERGNQPSGCSIDRKGTEYINLSAQTQGEVFDICKSDWTEYFNTMLSGIETLVNTSFPLATENIVEVTAVYLNNNRLSPGDWTYANRKITIREEAMQNQLQYNIRVELIEYVD